MKEGLGNDGFVRADQIDLKTLDEQLERHLNRAWTMEKKRDEGSGGEKEKVVSRQEWEIEPSKLIIKTVIARGTFGTVHRGIYDGLDVAVKLLDWGEEGHRTEAEIASLRMAFTQEVAVWHKLDHPNVTKFIGATMGSSELRIQTETGHIGMPSNICCVVVEYLPGGALKSYLIKNRRRKLAFKVVIQLALDLARGLSYLHSEKIVHRDVKTENMLLDKSRTVKIADFGVARVEAQNPNDMTGETGTLGYMAPEERRINCDNEKAKGSTPEKKIKGARGDFTLIYRVLVRTGVWKQEEDKDRRNISYQGVLDTGLKERFRPLRTVQKCYSRRLRHRIQWCTED